jgi:hypothetical protein
MTEIKFMLRNIRRIPYLLRNQAGFIGERFHCLQKALGILHPPSRPFVMGTLAGEQRPAPANTSAVKWGAISMLAITIVVITMPD